MRSDLFENYVCKGCGNKDISKFIRLEVIDTQNGRVIVCQCKNCGRVFFLPYEGHKSLGIKTLEEALEEAYQMQEGLDKKVYFAENKYIVINVVYPYEIELNRIKNEKELLWWIVHLMRKTWITRDVLLDFAEKVAKANKLKIEGSC